MVLFQRLLIALCLSFLPISLSQLVIPWGNDRRPVCDCLSNRPTPCVSMQQGCYTHAVKILVRQQSYSPCGGSLITERHVLCSAHCFHGRPARDFSCILNEMDMRLRQTIRVKTIQIHQSFQHSTYANDIAVLELAQAASMRGGLKTVVIPNRGFNLNPGTSLTALGWDAAGIYNKKKSAKVQTAQIRVSNPKACEGARKSGKKSPKRVDSKSQICVSGGRGQKRGRSGCVGGVGGLIQSSLRYDTIFGVSSFGGQEMCFPNSDPSLYTGVHNYGQWIYSMTRSARCAFCVSR